MDAQLRGPVFLASYPTATMAQLKGVAYVYDNAVAILALVGCDQAPKAAPVGDAILSALEFDRFWHDGRLRNAYLAGHLVDVPLKLPGWWDYKQNKWVEDQYQVGSDTGNMAWAMLALLSLYRAGLGTKYLTGAERIGAYVEKSYDAHVPKGFTGGTFGDEPCPDNNTWKSTEHNADLAAAFQQLANISRDAHWPKDAQEARGFVRVMWNRNCRCFNVGTAVDGHTINPMLALDAQFLPLLAVPGAATHYTRAVRTAEKQLTFDGGFAYSEARGGGWTEGTAQAALLMALAGRSLQRDALLAAIARNRTEDGSYYATASEKLPTGFMLQTDPSKPRLYFHLPHLGAVGWVALAQRSFNPFTGVGQSRGKH